MSGNSILRGESKRIIGTFRTASFPSAPTWTLYDWNFDSIQQGTATAGDAPHQWIAEITIPSNMVIPDGAQEITLEFVVTDSTGTKQILTKDLEVIDARDFDKRPYGIMWYPSEGEISESILLPQQPTSITLTLSEGYGAGTQIATETLDNPTPVASTSAGYLYDFTLSGLTFTKSTSGGSYPFQLMIKANYGSGKSLVTVRPVYGASAFAVSRVMGLRRYLDKGEFTDIDTRLQWTDEELIHFLTQGVEYFNAWPPTLSFWTIDDCPSPLNYIVFMAAAWTALNARYLAEGFNKFDFQSGGVNLDWDRRDTIQTKMDELKSALDSLLDAKKAAIRQFGIGTPLDGTKLLGTSIGKLGITAGPMTNVMYPAGYYGMSNFNR